MIYYNNSMRHFKESLIRLLYPAHCEFCGKPLALDENLLCETCEQNLEGLAYPLEKSLVDEQFENLDHAWAVYAYVTPLRELLQAVKYRRKDYLLKTFKNPVAKLATSIASECVYNALIPIPLNRVKRIQRQFNQSQILADLLQPFFKLPIWSNLLKKKYFIPSQTSMTREERVINIYGVFKVSSTKQTEGKSFLLVDDVLTTGATASEAARTLKKAGAKRVDLFALAKTNLPIKKEKSSSDEHP